MKFSVVTPSYNSLKWLPLCVESIADQEDVEVEHIVQDGASDDGTVAWAEGDSRIQFHSEPDEGMYDALNKAIARATGDVILHLNCDEQLLPGALKTVRGIIEADSETEAFFGDVLVVNPEGELMAYRKVVLPHWFRTPSHTTPTLTCGTFMRRNLFAEKELYFDTGWKDLGDKKWLMDAVDAGVKMKLMRRFTSAFTNTGANMNFSENAMMEKRKFRDRYPVYYKWLRPVAMAWHRFVKWRSGCYKQGPIDYEIYLPGAASEGRKSFHVEDPTFKNPFGPAKTPAGQH